MAVARQIVGPQEQFERTGAQSLRDIRPFTRGCPKGCAARRPAWCWRSVPVCVLRACRRRYGRPASALYALWVLTRRCDCRCACPDRPPAPMSATRRPADASRSRQRYLFHRLEHHRPGALGHRRRRTAAHHHPRHDRCRQDHGDPEPAEQRARSGIGLRAGGRQGGPRPVRQGDGTRAPVRSRG